MWTIWEEGFTQRYLMRRVGKEVDSVVATIPKVVIQRAARRKGLTLDEFLLHYQIEYGYNGMEEGFIARFVERDKAPENPDLASQPSGDWPKIIPEEYSETR